MGGSSCGPGVVVAEWKETFVVIHLCSCTFLGFLVCSEPKPSHLLLVFQHFLGLRRQDSLTKDIGKLSIQAFLERCKD